MDFVELMIGVGVGAMGAKFLLRPWLSGRTSRFLTELIWIGAAAMVVRAGFAFFGFAAMSLS